MANITTTDKFIYIWVNDFPSYDKVWENQEKGVVRYRGRDGDYAKTNYVKYPTSHFTEEYIRKNVLHRYDKCPKCTIGEKINNGGILKLKYSKENNTLYRKQKNNGKNNMVSLNIGNAGKRLGTGIKELGKSHEVWGQGLAQIPKLLIGLGSSELGNKVWNTVIGAIGNIINESYGTSKNIKIGAKVTGGLDRKRLLRSLFTNMMWTWADPTANQIRELTRNVDDLLGGLRTHNFSSAFGALIEDPQEIVGALRGAIPKFGKFKGFKGFKAPSLNRFKNRAVSRDNTIQEITPDLVTKFSGNEYSSPSFRDSLSDLDLVDY